MRFLVLAAALTLPLPALSAGGGTMTPPTPSETTKTCKGKRVWDEAKGRCVRPKESSLNEDGLYDAVRELAYAGRNEDAQAVLSAMADQAEARVLTYWGFTHRKLGNLELANLFYERAITQNPDNILARSYMGQGFVAEGRVDDAIAQWHEIKNRVGTGSWAEASLRTAIRTGVTYNY